MSIRRCVGLEDAALERKAEAFSPQARVDEKEFYEQKQSVANTLEELNG